MAKKEYTTDYALLTQQASGILKEEPWYAAAMSNLSALIAESMADLNWAGFYLIRGQQLTVGPFQGRPACIHIPADLNWAGFYLIRGQQLTVGPFQGRPACIHIPVGKGVCGTAILQDRMQVVPDVHKFPGHIACDSASASEIVIPIHSGERIAAVLDIDSPVKDRFSAEDAAGLAALVRLIEQKISWE